MTTKSGRLTNHERQRRRRDAQRRRAEVPLDASRDEAGPSRPAAASAEGVGSRFGGVVFRLQFEKARLEGGDFDSDLPLLFFVNDQELDAAAGGPVEVVVALMTQPDTFPWRLPETENEVKENFSQQRYCFRWSAMGLVPEDWHRGLQRARRMCSEAFLCLELPQCVCSTLYFRIFRAWCNAGYTAGVAPMLVNFDEFRRSRGDRHLETFVGQVVTGRPVSTYVLAGTNPRGLLGGA